MSRALRIIFFVGLLCAIGCTSRLVIATPNVTKPVLLSAKKCPPPGNAIDSSAEQSESFFHSIASGGKGDLPIPSDVDMAFLKADARDEKVAQITAIHAGSYHWFVLVMGGGNHWVDISAETCASPEGK